MKLETVKMHKVNCLVDDAVMQKLVRCKELLSGKYPGGIDFNALLMELATWDLEVHHDETPFAMGGSHALANLRLLCAAHSLEINCFTGISLKSGSA